MTKAADGKFRPPQNFSVTASVELSSNVADVFQLLLLSNVLLYLAIVLGVRRCLSAATIFLKATVRELPLAGHRGKNQTPRVTAGPVRSDTKQTRASIIELPLRRLGLSRGETPFPRYRASLRGDETVRAPLPPSLTRLCPL